MSTLKVILCLFWISFYGITFSQSSNTGQDEYYLYLESKKSFEKKEHERADSILNKLGVHHFDKNPSQFSCEYLFLKGSIKEELHQTDSIIYYFEKSRDMYNEIQDYEGYRSSILQLISPYLRSGKSDSALVYLDKIIYQDSTNNTFSKLMFDYRRKSFVYEIRGNTDRALSLLESSLELAEKKKDNHEIQIILMKIGRIYMNVEQYEHAENYMIRSGQIANQLDSSLMVSVNYHKTILYHKWDKLEMADSVNLRARYQSDSAGNPQYYATLLLQGARVAMLQGKYNKAESLGKRSYNIFRTNPSNVGFTRIYLFKARLQTKLEDFEKADHWVDSSLYYSKTLYDPLITIPVYHQKSIISMNLNDSLNYNKYFGMYNAMKDSIIGVGDLSAVFKHLDREMKDAEDHLSEKMKSLENALEIQENNNHSTQSWLKIILIASIVIIILLVFLFGIRDRIRKRSLKKEKILIEQKEKKIEKILESGGEIKLDLPPHFEQLSKREKEVFELLVKGRSDKEISEELFISLATVRTHVRHIYEKFHIKSRMKAKDIYLKYKV